jgi:hypothetical protein
MDAETIGFMPATEWAEKIRTKQFSPVEAMRALLDRITALDPKVNAFAYLAADRAMDAARAAEKAIMGGERIGRLQRQSDVERLPAGGGHAGRASIESRGSDHTRQDDDVGVRLERCVGKPADRDHA